MSPTRRYEGPTGILPPAPNSVTLSDADWEEVRDTFRVHVEREAPDRLRKALDVALDSYESTDKGVQTRRTTVAARLKNFSAPATPGQIKENLGQASRAAQSLLELVNALDGNSRQLIGENHEGGMSDLYNHLRCVIRIINDAEKIAREFPESRKGVLDYASRELGVRVAKAVCDFAGPEKLSAKKEGLFHQLYLIAFRALGQPSADRFRMTEAALADFYARRDKGWLDPVPQE